MIFGIQWINYHLLWSNYEIKTKFLFLILQNSLGDFIDGGEPPYDSLSDLEEMNSAAKQIRIPFYHVLGNHDLLIPKPRDWLLEEFGMKSNYYSFRPCNGWKFICLGILHFTKFSVYNLILILYK